MQGASRSAAAALAAVALSAPASAWDLAGTVRLVTPEGEEASAEEVASAVVYFEPAGGAPAVAPGAAEIAMESKEFAPRVVVTPPGSSVRFPNLDPILHNVFSVSGENAFDLGLYRRGEGKTATLAAPGLVQVFCNVHHEMVAYVLVLATPHVTRPARDGSFALAGLPGAGTLTLWHERGEALSVEVGPGGPPPRLELAIDRPRVPRHANKLGRPYGAETARRVYP